MIRIGIDLGANSIRLINEDSILFNEPCLIALDNHNHVLAIGNEAMEMRKHRDESIQVLFPITSTSINFDALDALLEQLCYQFKVFKKFHKKILLLSYPTGLSEEHRDMLKQHLLNLGAYRVYFDQEIWFSAIGAKLNLTLPITHCVMNIGSSNCDIATFSHGTIQDRLECHLAGNQVILALQKYLKEEKNLLTSYATLDTIQRKIGNVTYQSNPKSIQVQGMDATTKEPKSISLDENEIIKVLIPLVDQWAKWILRFIKGLSSEQQEDIRKRGIVACGGTMKLHGLQQELCKRIDIPFFITDDPVHTVAQGIQILLSNMD